MFSTFSDLVVKQKLLNDLKISKIQIFCIIWMELVAVETNKQVKFIQIYTASSKEIAQIEKSNGQLYATTVMD